MRSMKWEINDKVTLSGGKQSFPPLRVTKGSNYELLNGTLFPVLKTVVYSPTMVSYEIKRYS